MRHRKRSKRSPKRRTIVPRRSKWLPGGPRSLQYAPRGLQEASEEANIIDLSYVSETVWRSRLFGFSTLPVAS
eukprot:3181814-Pyramimonas_sp.AAC.1